MHSWPDTVALTLALLAALYVLFTFVRSLNESRIRADQERVVLATMIEQLDDLRRRRLLDEKAASAIEWKGWRPLNVSEKEQESSDICSFYLSDPGGETLPVFLPGQFLTVRLPAGEEGEHVVRCYSLSDCYRGDHYRISVKRSPPPKQETDGAVGSASNFLHDHIEVGDTVDVQPARGAFHLDPKVRDNQRVAVLVAGGVGITPLIAMLNGLLLEDPVPRKAVMFFGVRNRSQHPMADHLARMAREHSGVFSLNVCYSSPGEDDRLEGQYQHEGRVSADLIFDTMNGAKEAEFYICGPPAMMESLVPALRDLGVPDDLIHFEAFGPASVPKADGCGAVGSGSVTFSRSSQRIDWSGSHETILDAGEAAGVPLMSGCRSGNCGTCETTVVEGAFEYVEEPTAATADDACLTCIAVPKGDLVLDA